MKKRLAAVILGLVLIVSMAACAKSDSGGQAKGNNDGNTEDTGISADSSENAGDGSTGDSTETYEWNVSITFGEPATRNILAMLNEVEEKTNGRMKFNIYPSNSLVGITEVPDALRDGIADIALVASVNYPSILTYNAELIGMPFSGIEDSYQACELWHALYEEYPDEMQGELDEMGALVWYAYATPQYHILTTDNNEIRKPEDLKGHKIMSGKTQWIDFINQYGGVGIQQAPTAYYENLEKGVADGIIQSYTTTRTFGCLELMGSATEFAEEGAFYDMFFLAISQKSWNKLDAEVQQAFLDVNAGYAAEIAENDRSMADNASAIEELGEEFSRVILTDEEVQVWQEGMKPINEKAVSTLTETYKKDKTAEMYEWMLNWLEEKNAQ